MPTETQFMEFLPLLSPAAVKLCNLKSLNLIWEYINMFFLHVR